MKLFVSILAFLSIFSISHSVNCLDIENDLEIDTFEQFKAHFQKVYETDEDEQIARGNYERNRQWIAEHRDKLDFTVGITSWADEFHDFDDEVNTNVREFAPSHTHHDDHKVVIPEHFDWREKIWMSRIISQGKCGSCWAFVSAVMMEANLALRHNITVMLSKQELIDCTIKVATTNKKCHGGHASEGFRYVKKYGIHAEQNYPLMNMNNETHEFKCRTDAPGTKYTIKENHEKRHVKDHEIQELILSHGPVSAFIVGTDPEFRFYKGGVLKNHNKNPPLSKHNHEAILIGWGHDQAENVDYWIVRNSWGTWWGEHGFARIQRGINSIGINDYVNYLG